MHTVRCSSCLVGLSARCGGWVSAQGSAWGGLLQGGGLVRGWGSGQGVGVWSGAEGLVGQGSSGGRGLLGVGVCRGVCLGGMVCLLGGVCQGMVVCLGGCIQACTRADTPLWTEWQTLVKHRFKWYILQCVRSCLIPYTWLHEAGYTTLLFE